MIENIAVVLGLGFLIGIEHAFDPDHVVAVSSMVSKHKSIKKASILGSIWGLGHTTTLFIVGFALMLLKVTIPEKMAMSFEFIVGIMIVLLGVNVIRELLWKKKHLHVHEHDGKKHVHVHSHKGDKKKHKHSKHNHYHRPFIIGLIHGIAGSAGLMLLVLSTIESIWIGGLYILIFGMGSMIGMSIVSGIIGIPFSLTSNFGLWNKRIRYITGSLAIFFGGWLMFNVGVLEGLFF